MLFSRHGDVQLLQELRLVGQGHAGKLAVVGQPVGKDAARIVAVAGGLLGLGFLALLLLIEGLQLIERRLGLGDGFRIYPALGHGGLQRLIPRQGVVKAAGLLDVGVEGIGPRACNAEARQGTVLKNDAGNFDMRHVRFAVECIPGIVQFIGRALLLAVLSLTGLHGLFVRIVERLGPAGSRPRRTRRLPWHP